MITCPNGVIRMHESESAVCLALRLVSLAMGPVVSYPPGPRRFTCLNTFSSLKRLRGLPEIAIQLFAVCCLLLDVGFLLFVYRLLLVVCCMTWLAFRVLKMLTKPDHSNKSGGIRAWPYQTKRWSIPPLWSHMFTIFYFRSTAFLPSYLSGKMAAKVFDFQQYWPALLRHIPRRRPLQLHNASRGYRMATCVLWPLHKVGRARPQLLARCCGEASLLQSARVAVDQHISGMLASFIRGLSFLKGGAFATATAEP